MKYRVKRLIDAHVHWHEHGELDPVILEIIRQEFPDLFSHHSDPNDPTFLLELLDLEQVERAHIINYVSHDVMGFTTKAIDWVVQFCENTGGRLIPVGGVDAKGSHNAGEAIRGYLETGLLKMVKVHGPHQLLYPNDYLKGVEGLHNLYDVCMDLKIPVIFHTGTSIFPKARSKFGNPLCLEDVLIDFPDLRVVIAHGGRPFWTAEFEYIMQKYPKVIFDISGVPPSRIGEYFPRFARYADRVMFGSDFPSPRVKGMRRNAELLYGALADYGLSNGVVDRIFYANARSLV